MYLSNQLTKAKEEMAMGLKDKAARRLRAVINAFPDSMEARDVLARMYYKAGFLDAAGRYWILTEPTEDYLKECIDAYKKSVNYSEEQILKDIKYRGDKSGLTKYALDKLNSLEAAALEKTGFKNNYNKSTLEEDVGAGESWWDKGLGYVGCSIAIAILVLFLVVLLLGVDSFFDIFKNK